MANRSGIRGREVDLYVRFVDSEGAVVNTDDVPLVKITDSQSVVRRSFNNSGVVLTDDPGLYKLTYTIPINSPSDSYWIDTWNAKIGDEEIIADFAFYVSSSGTAEVGEPVDYQPGDEYVFTYTKEEVQSINYLLSLLRKRLKNNGKVKVPDGFGGFVDRDCAVFSNDELVAFLVSSLSEFNQFPHFTQFKFTDPQITGIFTDIILQGAQLLAYSAQAIIERGREFNFTDNGITFQMPAISEILNNQYTTQLADYKEKLKAIKYSLKPAPLGLGSFRVLSVSPAYLRLRHLRSRQLI